MKSCQVTIDELSHYTSSVALASQERPELDQTVTDVIIIIIHLTAYGGRRCCCTNHLKRQTTASQPAFATLSPYWRWPSPVSGRWSSWWEPIAARDCWWRLCGRKWGTRWESRRSLFFLAEDAKMRRRWEGGIRSGDEGQKQHTHPPKKPPEFIKRYES